MWLSGCVSGVGGLMGYGKERHGEQNPVPLFLRCQELEGDQRLSQECQPKISGTPASM